MIIRQNQELLGELMQPRIVPIITKQPECLLEAMEIISKSASNSYLKDDFFKTVEIPTNYLSERFQITPIQAVLFSLLMDHTEYTSIRLRDIAEMLDCITTRLLRFSKSLEDLAENFLIRIRKGRDEKRLLQSVLWLSWYRENRNRLSDCVVDWKRHSGSQHRRDKELLGGGK